jgi:hypothetical protein
MSAVSSERCGVTERKPKDRALVTSKAKDTSEGWAGGGRDARLGPRQRSDLKRMTNIVLVYGERPVSSDAGSLLVRMAATAAIMRKPATKPMLIQVRRLSSSSAIGTAKVQSITVAFDHTRRSRCAWSCQTLRRAS